MVADQRHLIYHLETNSAQVNSSSEKASKIVLPMSSTTITATHTSSYGFVTADLRKTAIVTASIIIAQIILLIILNRV